MIEPTPVQQSRCKCPRNALVHVKVKFCKPIEVTVVCLIGPADGQVQLIRKRCRWPCSDHSKAGLNSSRNSATCKYSNNAP